MGYNKRKWERLANCYLRVGDRLLIGLNFWYKVAKKKTATKETRVCLILSCTPTVPQRQKKSVVYGLLLWERSYRRPAV